jgi:hypothetical protein
LVEEVVPPKEDSRDSVVWLACPDDDAIGQITEAYWEREVDPRVLGQSTRETSSAGRWQALRRRCRGRKTGFTSAAIPTAIRATPACG